MSGRPRIAFLVNGAPGSALAERGSAFAERIREEFETRLIHRDGRRLAATGRMVQALAAYGPQACYVLDLGAAGVAAAGLYRHATGTPFIVDTGDAVVELGQALGRGPLGIAATRALDAYATRAAAALVVRGQSHRRLFADRGRHAEFIPDGVDVDRFAVARPARVSAPNRPLVIGLLGTSVWVSGRQTCYGWELVELIQLLHRRSPLPFRGVLIGGGSGVAILKRRAAQYGIADDVEFAGQVPYTDLPERLREFDICLSTQTNDIVGQVRTTGKLPLYLAAGRFVLASRVGEAARVLPAEMLVEFTGAADPSYPSRLADRVLDLVQRGTDFSFRPDSVALAREHFDYDRLAPRVAQVLARVLGLAAAPCAGSSSGSPA